ncbi:MAG: HNH/ENDO VII family nuclease, partial [Vicinamibacteria bacterium]
PVAWRFCHERPFFSTLLGAIVGRFTKWLLTLERSAARGQVGRLEVAFSKYWNRATVFQGNKVYQRDDLIDPFRLDARGRTNLERMRKGIAPVGPDGLSMNLHHMLQTQAGPIAEVTASFHQGYYSIIHINPNTVPSGIDRAAFDAWRRQYWVARALDF